MRSEKSIKRENSKKEKLKVKAHSGITLIALVITIIVLLILAGVALATLTGDSGILSNAEKAKENTVKANAKEQLQLAVQGALTEGYAEGHGTINRANLKTELDSIVGKENKDYTLSEGEGPWTVKIGEYEATISQNGNVIGPRDTETLPSAEGTTPWLPEGFSQVAGTTLDNGLTITNSTGLQNYVWIEVPTTISASVTRGETATTVSLANAQNDSEIYTILEAYAGDYIKGDSTQDYGSWTEEWYDLYNATWDGESEYALISGKSRYFFADWEEYYGESNVYTSTVADVTEEEMILVDFDNHSYSSSNYYFVKVDDNFKNHDDGCGLTYEEYQKEYSNMLSSIQKYGGFWLAQYEAGITYEEEGATTATNRTSSSSRITNPTSANYAKDQYPYSWVYCSEAQKIASADSTSSYTSSLPFGIQWDLVCKFLEVKNEQTGLTYSDIATQSTWGNYSDTGCTSSANSKYSSDYGETFKEEVLTKSSGLYILTTGAIEQATATVNEQTVTKDASPMNIYDFAGNTWEWTLERATVTVGEPCATRSGNSLRYRNACAVRHLTVAMEIRDLALE